MENLAQNQLILLGEITAYSYMIISVVAIILAGRYRETNRASAYVASLIFSILLLIFGCGEFESKTKLISGEYVATDDYLIHVEAERSRRDLRYEINLLDKRVVELERQVEKSR